MTLEWASVEKMIESVDIDGLLAATVGVDDRQRRALAKPLREHHSRWRTELEWPDGATFNDRWARRRRQATALAVAGALCLATPAAVAEWLAKVDADQFESGPTSAALRRRPAEFRAEVASRLAASLRTTSGGVAVVAFALLAETGGAPLATEGFVVKWIEAVTSHRVIEQSDRPGMTLLDALREFPLTPRMVPLLFEVDSAGSWLAGHADQPWGSWAGALATLGAEGAVDRDALLDGCLRRLLRGGRLADLRAYQQIFEALDPTADELAPRVRDLVRLLPDTPSTIASMVQQRLRGVDAAGRLGPDTALESAGLVLARTEKKLITAELRWLEQLAARTPHRLGELVATVTIAFHQPAVDVQRQAVSIVERHLSTVDDEVRRVVTAAAANLPADLRQRLGLMPATAPVSAPTSAPTVAPAIMAAASTRSSLAAPPARQAMPEPIQTVAELAEEVAGILERPGESDTDPVALERVLAALVALAHVDRSALRDGLAPVLQRLRIPSGRLDGNLTREGLAALVAAAIDPVTGVDPAARSRRAADELEWRKRAWPIPVPLRVLLFRMHETTVALAHQPVPALVAEPTEATGRLDATVLLARLERAAAQGWEPLRYDLDQALLRLPRTVEPALVQRAEALHTESGRRLADWVRHGGLPDPRVQVSIAEQSERKRVPTVVVEAGSPATADTAVPWVPLPRSVASRLVELPEPQTARTPYEAARWVRCWPLVLPSHPDVVGAHLAHHLIMGQSGAAAALPALAEADGPVGEGLALALAFGLGAPRAEDRAAAVDALLVLAARPAWAGTVFGEMLGDLVGALLGAWLLKATRVVPALRDALNAGAAEAVWAVVAGALPSVLGAKTPVHRLGDLLVLGFDTAEARGVRGEVTGLAEFAAGAGASRALTEARRLHCLLTDAHRVA